MEGDEDTETKRERVQTSTHNYAARAVVVASRRRERSVRDPLQIIYELPSYFFPVESDATSGAACVRCFLEATYPDIFVKPINTYVDTYALTSTPLRRRCTCQGRRIARYPFIPRSIVSPIAEIVNVSSGFRLE